MIEVFYLNKNFLVFENKNVSTLLNKNYGIKKKDFLVLNEFEVLELLEKNKILVYEKMKNKENEKLSIKEILQKTKTKEENFLVFKDLKNKGFVLKTAFKFGFDFRVYEKNEKENKHSKYFLKVLKENSVILAKKYISDIRISNTSKKDLILAFVDREFSITYTKVSRIKNLN